MSELSKGANAPVPTAELTVEVSWQSVPGVDADASALLLTSAGKVRDDGDFVFYNQAASPEGSVRHVGAIATGGDRLVVDASSVPAAVERVAFVASIHDGAERGHSFAQLPGLRIQVLAGGAPVASYAISGLTTETGLIFGELYRRQGAWKFRAVGQGYDSGLAGIAGAFGISVDDEPAAAPAAPAAPMAPTPATGPPPAPASPIDMRKQRQINLRKQVSDAAPVMLQKLDAATVSLEKRNLADERAEVVLVLDVSGSSQGLFRDGSYQDLVDRFLTLGLLFDDNGTVDTYLFDHRLQEGERVTLANREGWTDRATSRPNIWGGTQYAPSIDQVASRLTRGAALPTYVAFITDGANGDTIQAADAVRRASGLPMFIQFMAIGVESAFPFLQSLDKMPGREVDNAGFFALQNVRQLSDEAFYERVMQEFPMWLWSARSAGIVAGDPGPYPAGAGAPPVSGNTTHRRWGIRRR